MPPEPASKIAFVTGGTGFVGSHLVKGLLHRGYTEVRCLVRSSLKWLNGLDADGLNGEPSRSAIVPVYGDLHDTEALKKGCAGADYVFHVAGVTGTKEKTNWEGFVAGNVHATTTLLEAVRAAAPDVRKVLVTSSLAAVGICAEGIATEETPLNPISLYGRSKADMEAALAAYQGRLPLVVVRPPVVYGPRDTDVLVFFKAVSQGICPVIGDGKAPDLSLIHARDLVRGMIDAAESERTRGETYFISSERPYAWNEVKAAACTALGRNALTIRVPEVLIEPIGAVVEGVGRLFGRHPPLTREKAREARYACKMCSAEKARRDFGFTQKIPLEQGVEETIAWYRSEGWL